MSETTGGTPIELPAGTAETANALAAMAAQATASLPFAAEPMDFLTVLEAEADAASDGGPRP